MKAAAFTNLSATISIITAIERYFAAKARLFAERQQRMKLLNADVPEYEALADMVQGRILTYGRNGTDLIFRDATPTRRGTWC